MDQVTSAEQVDERRLPDRADDNGLADRVAAVEAARAQLGHDLDRLTVETRAQMGQTMEKIAWKSAAAGAGVLAGLAMRKLLAVVWTKARGQEPPSLQAPGLHTNWGEALAWSGAMAAGMAAAKLVAIRGAATGWQKATGVLPPGLDEGAA